MTITLADISEFQENIDAPTYIRGGHTCLIVRAHNGYRLDNKWPARRDYLRQYPFHAVGFYQYLVADRPAADQAHDFIAAVGDIRPNEFVILDHEEGSGDQTGRAEAWFSVVDAHYGKPSTLYSGESFGTDHLGGWSRWAGRPRWIAAYRMLEPTEPHDLWQNTDSKVFPGIGTCDGNVFRDDIAAFVRTFCRLSSPVPGPLPAPPGPLLGENMIEAVVKQNGAIELFYESPDHEVLHTWQVAPNSSWWGAQKGKRHAGWESLGKPQENRT